MPLRVKEPFNEWWFAVTQEAKRRGAEHLLGDQESHRDGFEDGYTATEEITETIDSAAASM